MNHRWMMNRYVMLAVVSLLTVSVARAQENDPLNQAGEALRNAMRRVMIPSSKLTDGPQVRSAFREVVADAAEATVAVRLNGKQVALGGIVGRDGWVITKADQLKGETPTCKLKDGREFDARVVGIDNKYDMAMLKIEAKNLPVLSLKRDDDATVGEWVATVAPDRDPVAVGIVAVDTRRIRPQRGWLGIQMDTSTDRPRIALVYEGSAAEQAGLLVNDEIVEINGEATNDRERLFRTIGKYSPGDLLAMKIKRGSESLSVEAVLTPPVKGMPNDRRQFQNNLGSELSDRRFGFDAAFQHDTVLKPVDCGGPLVDLEGHVVGFNISRSGRTESYAIPANVAITRFYDLMSGNLPPKVRNKVDAPDEEQPVNAESEPEPEEASAE
ncbi:trypsin-like peptidase domain-containing protein [Aeoliella mucimassa]|uniref:Serine protease HtrA n=1 Tax=Aeoliella mucimassa TaxID=2527972 RepID=A0A518AJ15_9BACT|nr:trypsin-like peptidase domain-containing protein [Aeoliella mucimassa]QDU54729.1 Putative serine protease HtrA [Aeoliella mucimassa]